MQNTFNEMDWDQVIAIMAAIIYATDKHSDVSDAIDQAKEIATKIEEGT